MELVSLYCFGEESLSMPEPELVQKFIQYVIKEGKETQDFSPFDGQAVDATPVVRSFILQQLLSNKERYCIFLLLCSPHLLILALSLLETG